MRKLLIGLTVLALLTMGGVAMAQPAPACGTLAAADCEILTQSAAAQANLTSASFTFALDINAGSQAIPLTGDGAYAIDPAVLAALNSQATSSVTDPTAIFGLIGQALGGFDGQLNIDIMGTPINLVLVDGIGYLNFEPFAPFLQGAPVDIPAGWAGLNFNELISMLPMLASSFDMDSLDTTAAAGDQEALMAAVMEHVVIVRGPDENGQAVFVTSLDLAGLLQNEAFFGMIMSQMPEGQELTEEQLAQVGPIMESVASGIAFSATQKIDLSTFYSTSVAFEFALDGDAISAISGEAVEDVVVAGSFNFADFNAAPAIAAPAGAPVAGLAELAPLLMGGMGGAGF